MSLRALAVLLAAVLAAGSASGGDDFLERWALTYRFRLGRPEAATPSPDGRSVLFLRSGPRSFVRDLYELDLASGRERVLLTAETLLGGEREELSAEERARRERQRLAARGIASYELSRDGRLVLVPLSGRLFLFERATGAVREMGEATAGFPLDPLLSPDGSRIALVRNGELHVIEVAGGAERRLTSGASEQVSHGLAEFVAQEEMDRDHGFWWSPDSRALVYQRSDTSALERFAIADAADPAKAVEHWPYPRPGKPNADVRLAIVPVAGGEPTWIEWDRERSEYLTRVVWDEDAPLTIVVQDRRQQELRVLAVDHETGATRELLVERDPAWVELDSEVPRWLPGGAAFLWTTERRGARQLELRGRDGSLVAELTPPGLGLSAVAGVVADGTVVLEAGADPTETALWGVEARAGAVPRPLATAPGVHDAELGRQSRVWADAFESASGERSWRVMRDSAPTEHGLRSVAEDPGLEPRLEFVTTATEPSFHAVLVRPRDFAAGRRYPVLVHVYGGPTSQMVRRQPSRYLLDQWIADRGWVVVAIDGRGTPGRGRDWSRAVRGDLASLPLADQAAALRALGARHPELDLDRVGIWGWSFGGSMAALAVMREGQLFRAGVAGAPVTDWRDYDTHYTERYMGLPEENPEGYRETSALHWADTLDRPLLVIHGTADDNVYFLHSLKLADALFRAGKTYEFLPLAGYTHMVPDPLVTRRLYERIVEFLDRHVKHAVPRGGPSLDEQRLE